MNRNILSILLLVVLLSLVALAPSLPPSPTPATTTEMTKINDNLIEIKTTSYYREELQVLLNERQVWEENIKGLQKRIDEINEKLQVLGYTE